MDNLEQRVANIEGTVSQMSERLNDTNLRMNHLSDNMKEMETSLSKKIDSNFKWTLAIILASWITMIGTFVGFFIALLDKLPK